MRLKEFRKKAKLTQQQVADYLGCSQAVYNRYEKETREPANEILMSLADLYGVTVDVLLGHESNKKSGWHSLPPDMKKLFSAEHPVPDILDFGASTTNPAMLGGINDAVMRLFDEASDLSPEEADQARAFVLGLKANRKPGPVPPPSDQK